MDRSRERFIGRLLSGNPKRDKRSKRLGDVIVKEDRDDNNDEEEEIKIKKKLSTKVLASSKPLTTPVN